MCRRLNNAASESPFHQCAVTHLTRGSIFQPDNLMTATRQEQRLGCRSCSWLSSVKLNRNRTEATRPRLSQTGASSLRAWTHKRAATDG
jgi:hypothetical protein